MVNRSTRQFLLNEIKRLKREVVVKNNECNEIIKQNEELKKRLGFWIDSYQEKVNEIKSKKWYEFWK